MAEVRRCAGAAAGADQGPPRGHLAARRAPGGRGAAARRAAGAALSLFVWRRCAGAAVRRLALTRGRLVATWQRGAHPEAAALLRAVLQVLHCHCLYGGGAPVRPVRRLALTRGRLVATWQRGAHPEAAALLRAVLQGPPRGHLAARRAPGGRGAAARRAAGAALSLFVWRRCRCAGAAAGADQGPPRGHLAARRAPGGRGAAARRAAGAALSLFVWRRCAGAPVRRLALTRGRLVATWQRGAHPEGRGAAARRAAGAALSLFVWRRCAGAAVRRLALTRGRLVATWQRGAHPEAAALLRAVLQVLHCHCLYGGGAPVRRCGGWR
ncbi:hypothetical protein ACJJTC_016885 [Scirpophaga incertulas]